MLQDLGFEFDLKFILKCITFSVSNIPLVFDSFQSRQTMLAIKTKFLSFLSSMKYELGIDYMSIKIDQLREYVEKTSDVNMKNKVAYLDCILDDFSLLVFTPYITTTLLFIVFSSFDRWKVTVFLSLGRSGSCQLARGTSFCQCKIVL